MCPVNRLDLGEDGGADEEIKESDSRLQRGAMEMKDTYSRG